MGLSANARRDAVFVGASQGGAGRATLRYAIRDAERMETHETLRRGFLEIATEDPKRCVLIDGLLPIDSVAVAVWQAVHAHLLAEVL